MRPLIYCKCSKGELVMAAGSEDEPCRNITSTFIGLTCTRCGWLAEDELEAEEHLNGPMCEPSV
jgi:hypothetical protein